MERFKLWQKRKPAISAGVISDVGRVRRKNEDNYLLDGHLNRCSDSHSSQMAKLPCKTGKWHVAGIFDGMGGGEAGELAAKAAASVFQQSLSSCGGTSREMLEQNMRRCFQQANNETLKLQAEHQVFGTTGTVLCTDGQVFRLFHLGDSRCYLLRGGILTQLTKDQTLAQMKLEIGMYHPEDPQAEQDKHRLTEYIGRDWSGENLRPLESGWRDCGSGDIFLLCSDGLYDMCPDSRVLQILQQALPVEKLLEQLTEAANQAGGIDNITCMILKIQ